MNKLPRGDAYNGSHCTHLPARHATDCGPASPNGRHDSAGVAPRAAAFSQEWPAETTCPTVELPTCELPDAATKSPARKWENVAYQEIGVALFAIVLLVIVTAIGGVP